MPVREIKTTLSLDGEKQFKQELADARKEMRVMNADLKAMAAEFDSTGDEQKFFSQRVDLLNDKVKQQDELVKALNKAVKDSAEKYGDAASKTQDYRIQLSNATAQLFKMRREAEEAQRDLDDLGRGTRKTGREIKEGIGDAAEETAGKLESMFDKMVGDVNTMKNSVAWSTTMDVGEFVIDTIGQVIGFVQENQEYNRRIAMAKTAIAYYGYNWDEILDIVYFAESVTGDWDTALEGVVNLASAGFEEEKQILSAVKGLLGGYGTSMEDLDFVSLAGDFLESVKTKEPTGTFAELIEKFTNRNLEDIKKMMESTKTIADTLEIATAVMTEAGLQTRTEEYINNYADIVRAERVEAKIQERWANIAKNIQPAVNNWLESWEWLLGKLETFTGWISEDNANLPTIDEIDAKRAAGEPLTMVEADIKRDEIMREFFDWLIPSAGAESMSEFGPMTTTLGDTSAIGAAIKTDIAMMRSESVMEEVNAAGYDLMVSFGNGIAEGASIPLKNVQDLVAQINATLASIETSAFGLGWSGISGGNIALYMDGQKVGALAAGGVSTALGRKVDTRMMVK